MIFVAGWAGTASLAAGGCGVEGRSLAGGCGVEGGSLLDSAGLSSVASVGLTR